jgi:hypothetical protein
MVHFCEAVAQEIRLAHVDNEVDRIIDNSLVLFHKSKSQSEWTYSINMIAILRASREEAKTIQERSNMKRAIEIFGKHLQLNTNNLF